LKSSAEYRKTPQRHNPQDLDLNLHRRGNKSRNKSICRSWQRCPVTHSAFQ